MMLIDEAYVEARRVLLDALKALEPHAQSLVLVGAQAVYLRTEPGDFAVAPYTTDGDLAVDPGSLAAAPEIEVAMSEAGFKRLAEPGIWHAAAVVNGQRTSVPVDLIVPEGFAPPGGRRGARLGPHGNRSARRAIGLEATLVDKSPMTIEALDPNDGRSVTIDVAGVAALLVAKAHKLHERAERGRLDRLNDKDAADVFRIMQVAPAKAVRETLSALRGHSIAGQPTTAAIGYLDELFGHRGGRGIQMAARSFGGAIPQPRVEAICLAYAAALREVLDPA